MQRKKNSVSKSQFSTSRDMVSFAISAILHVSFVIAIALIPQKIRKSREVVDLTVSTVKPAPEVVEEPEVIPESESEPEPKKKPKKKRKPIVENTEPPPLAPPPEEKKLPEDAPEAPPVFDLGDNTFAKGKGQQSGWSLQRSEGNTKFAGLAKDDQPSVRNTKPTGDKDGVPGGTGPVSLKNLSRRPRPRSGGISLPPYPLEARREGIEGAVVLQVFINRQGNVYKTRVIKDPGGGLGEVARAAMLKEKWTPPLDKQGKPVSTVIVYSYRFVLDG
jgi:TonB family protein